MNNYLSKQRAISYLEEIQKQCLVSRFGLQFEERLNQLRGNLESDIQKHPSSIGTKLDPEINTRIRDEISSTLLFTKYEIAHSFIILKTLFESASTALKSTQNKSIKVPFIGTAHSREYNAFAVRVPGTDEHLVVIEGELFMLANLLSKLVVSSLPDLKDNSFSFDLRKAINHIENNTILKSRFSELVTFGMCNGEPSRCTQYFLDDGFPLTLQYQILNSIELFVVTHELGHIYCGHLNNSDSSTLLIKDKEHSKIKQEWEMEFEADAFGLKLLLQIVNQTGLPPFSYLGPELFFTFLTIDERSRLLDTSGNIIIGNTHPPSDDRRLRIRNELGKLLPKDQLESYNLISDLFRNILEAHWSLFKKHQGFKGSYLKTNI